MEIRILSVNSRVDSRGKFFTLTIEIFGSTIEVPSCYEQWQQLTQLFEISSGERDIPLTAIQDTFVAPEVEAVTVSAESSESLSLESLLLRAREEQEGLFRAASGSDVEEDWSKGDLSADTGEQSLLGGGLGGVGQL